MTNQPDIGRVEVYRGQRYELARREPYTRKRDGVQIVLLIWRASCLDCGEEFETATAEHALEFKPQHRRCKQDRTRRRLAWRDRVQETDPALIDPTLPDGRPITPIEAYEGDGK